MVLSAWIVIFRYNLGLIFNLSLSLGDFWKFHSWSAEKVRFKKSPLLGAYHQTMILEHSMNTYKVENTV